MTGQENTLPGAAPQSPNAKRVMHSRGGAGFDVPMGHCWYLNVMPTLELKPAGARNAPSHTRGQERLSVDGEVGAQDSQMEREVWTHTEAQLSG